MIIIIVNNFISKFNKKTTNLKDKINSNFIYKNPDYCNLKM